MPNITYDFSGRTAIVTGAARGIGLELARAFQAAGADTFVVDVEADAAEAAAAEIGGRSAVANVASTDDVERVVRHAIDETGRIDILDFRFTRACTPHFREAGAGRVINVTSYTGLHGNIGQAAYAAAKAGIIGFTKTAAKELGRFGITVNAISPNAETRMIESMPHEAYEAVKSIIPLGRFGAPAEMSAAVAFLASDEAAYVTGTVLPIDGGLAI
jgi:3-oxoacyl-[acyl-carrier protein] reductase